MTTITTSKGGRLTHPLDLARDHLARHVKFSTTHGAEIAALWAAHTWLLQPGETADPDRAIWHTPRLLVSASGPGSGKSTLLEYVAHLSRDPELVGSATVASLWGLSEQDRQPTVLYDEGDVTIDPYGPIRALINDGFEPGRGRLLQNGDAKARGGIRQSAYFPLVLSGNDLTLADDSTTRCIEVVLTPARPGDIEVEPPWARLRTVRQIGQALGEWATDPETIEAVLQARDDLASMGRDADRWRALLQIAHAAGGSWTGTARALAALDGSRRGDQDDDRPVNAHIAFLRDLRAVWPSHTSFMSTRQIIEALAHHSPHLWSDTGRHGPLTAARIREWINRAAAAMPHLDVTTVYGTDPSTGRKARGRNQWVMEALWREHGLALEPADLAG